MVLRAEGNAQHARCTSQERAALSHDHCFDLQGAFDKVDISFINIQVVEKILKEKQHNLWSDLRSPSEPREERTASCVAPSLLSLLVAATLVLVSPSSESEKSASSACLELKDHCTIIVAAAEMKTQFELRH